MAEADIGVIGAGHWGQNLVRNYAALGRLRAICDSDPARLADFASRYPAARVHTDVGTMLADDAVAAVVIASPAELHGAMVRAALESGRHVFVEKPLALDIGEAEDLIVEADRRGRVLMVGHLLLYHGAFRALAAALTGGELGALRYIYSNRLSLGRIRRQENALWSFAPHDISMILQLTGALPRSVVAHGGHYLTPGIADTTITHMEFGAGVQAHIFVSWLHPYKDQRLVVIGERAMAVFNDVAKGPDKLLLYRHAVGWQGEVPVVTQAQAEPLAYDPAEPLRAECEAFLAAIDRGARPPSDGREGIRVLTVLDACQRSMAAGGRIVLAQGAA